MLCYMAWTHHPQEFVLLGCSQGLVFRGKKGTNGWFRSETRNGCTDDDENCSHGSPQLARSAQECQLPLPDQCTRLCAVFMLSSDSRPMKLTLCFAALLAFASSATAESLSGLWDA